jgi:hypothetical protein
MTDGAKGKNTAQGQQGFFQAAQRHCPQPETVSGSWRATTASGGDEPSFLGKANLLRAYFPAN